MGIQFSVLLTRKVTIDLTWENMFGRISRNANIITIFDFFPNKSKSLDYHQNLWIPVLPLKFWIRQHSEISNHLNKNGMIELETKNVCIEISYYTEVKLVVSLWAYSFKNIGYNLVAKSTKI